jgi:hypothetical protein
MKCPNPNCVNGKVEVETPVTADVMGTEWIECEVCHGLGEITEDLEPVLITALYQIVQALIKTNEALEKINKKLEATK